MCMFYRPERRALFSWNSDILAAVITNNFPHIHRDILESIDNGTQGYNRRPIYKCCKFSSSLSPSRKLLPCWGTPSQPATVPSGTFSRDIRPGSLLQPEREPKRSVESSCTV